MREVGYAFALPRSGGAACRSAKRAGRNSAARKLTAWVSLVFGISCVFVARALLPLVRPLALQLLVLFFLPFAIWAAYLLLHYVNSLLAALLRKLGIYTAVTNNPLQHVIIMSLTTVLAVILVARRNRLDEIVRHFLARTSVAQPSRDFPRETAR